ncbi:MAG TPA: DUF2892 domain-containing protein [Longimicrobiales bacterium]|nr:DUF2892 domain-containing protein [Longimicrobiales bacterium]
MSAYDELDVSPHRNVDDVERAASLAGGAYLAWKGIGRDSMMGLALMGVGAFLLHRGVTGHCDLYQAMGASTASPRPYDGGEDEDDELDYIEDDEDLLDADEQVDEAGEESFPASDPPSFTPGGPTEPDQL